MRFAFDSEIPFVITDFQIQHTQLITYFVEWVLHFA
jgi:hypothetical protein